MIMVVEITSLTVVDLERLILSKLDAIRDAGDGKITRKSMETALGVDDEGQKKWFKKKLRLLKCFDRRGAYYYPKVDRVYDVDEEIIEMDPMMKILDSCITENDMFSKNRVLTEYFGALDIVYKCEDCSIFDPDKKWCAKKGKGRMRNDPQCNEHFKFNPYRAWRYARVKKKK